MTKLDLACSNGSHAMSQPSCADRSAPPNISAWTCACACAIALAASSPLTLSIKAINGTPGSKAANICISTALCVLAITTKAGKHSAACSDNTSRRPSKLLKWLMRTPNRCAGLRLLKKSVNVLRAPSRACGCRASSKSMQTTSAPLANAFA